MLSVFHKQNFFSKSYIDLSATFQLFLTSACTADNIFTMSSSSIDRPVMRLPTLPNEILYHILKSIPDFISLRKFTLAYPLAAEFLKHSPQAILVFLINRIEPLECRNLVSATLASRYNPRAECCGYPLDTREHSCRAPRPLDIDFTVSCIPDPVEAVRDMAWTFGDVDYFLKTFTRSCFLYCGLRPADQEALSATETHRIRRALWRFQFLCEVAYPRSTIGSAGRRRQIPGGDTRMRWLTGWLGWEYVELECVYSHLRDQFRELATQTNGDPSSRRQRKASIRSQSAIVQRLVTTIGFDLDDPMPSGLDSGRKGEKTRSNFLKRTFPTWPCHYRQRIKAPNAWDDGFVNGPNEGWETLMRYQRRGGLVIWPLSVGLWRGDVDLQRRGFCIWDKERFADWPTKFEFEL